MKIDEFLKANPHRSALDAVTLADLKSLEGDAPPEDAAKVSQIAELEKQLAALKK